MPARRFFKSAAAVLWGVLLALPRPAHAGAAVVDRAYLSGIVNSISASYLGAAVDRANADGATALIVVTDTPGGISTSMDEIVGRFLNSPVPIVVYVAPAGARADSAGLFIAQAADLVAMAPGTNLGSAHPISSSGTDLGGDLGQKVLNDAVTRIRSLAQMHGRNPDWAEQAVRQSANVGAEEAVHLGVADLIARDFGQLLQALDGRSLRRPSGQEVALHTAGAQVNDLPMSAWQELLHALIDPNVAYLLMLVAIYGLIAEVTTPGAILPGVAGVICAILALVAFTSLPVNIAGVLLIAFAIGLFIADVKAATHGVLTAGGLIALVLGSALLIDTGPVGLGLNPFVIAAAALLTVIFFVLMVRRVLAARRRTPFAGSETLIGSHGEAREQLAPEGLVAVGGVLWKGFSSGGAIAAGAPVRVVRRQGLQLEVAPLSEAELAAKEKTT